MKSFFAFFFCSFFIERMCECQIRNSFHFRYLASLKMSLYYFINLLHIICQASKEHKVHSDQLLHHNRNKPQPYLFQYQYHVHKLFQVPSQLQDCLAKHSFNKAQEHFQHSLSSQIQKTYNLLGNKSFQLIYSIFTACFNPLTSSTWLIFYQLLLIF